MVALGMGVVTGAMIVTTHGPPPHAELSELVGNRAPKDTSKPTALGALS